MNKQVDMNKTLQAITSKSSEKIASALFFVLLFLSSFIAKSQDIAISNLTNGLAANPLVGGANDRAIFGFKLSKAGGGGNGVDKITVALTQNPTGIITNARLYRSTNDDFDGIGSETLVVAGSFVGSTIEFEDGPITDFGGGSGAVTRQYFIVVNIEPAASGTLRVSLDNDDVEEHNDDVTGSATGTDYSFLTTTITSLNGGANNVAASPLIPNTTGLAVYGFSLSSNGSQTLEQLNIQLTNDPTNRLTTWSLVRSTDTDFATGGNNTTVGGLTFNVSATEVEITGLSEDVSSAKNYFLVANVAASPTGTIQASLGASNVTVNQGIVAGSASGTNYSFLTTTITSLNSVSNNVAASPLIATTIGNAVFGFSLSSNGNQTVEQLNIQLTSDPANKLATWSLVRSVDTDFTSTGDNTTIGGLTLNASTTEVVITGLTENVSTAKNYFLVANVDPSVTNMTATIRASLGNTNVTFAGGLGVADGSADGVIYSFATPTTTIGSLNAGANNVAPSPLVATTTGRAVFGFSLTSNGSQTVEQLNIQLTSDPANKLATWSLVRSTDTDFATTGNNTTIGGLTITASTTEVQITGLAEDVSTAKNYFLVANIDPSVTNMTATIRASLGSTNVAFASGLGNATGTATGIDYSFTSLTTTIGSLNAGANNVAPSPLVATTTGRAVFGFSLTSNGSQTVEQLNIQLTSDPANKLATWSLVRSTDTDFATTGNNTTIGGLTLTASTTEVQITGLAEDVSTAKNYFLVANVDPSVNGLTPAIRASLANTNVTFAGGLGNATGTATGIDYNFTTLTTTIGSLNAGANNVAPSPLVASTTGRAVFGFSLTSNGSQTVEQLNIQLTSDPANKLATWSLVRSTDTDFATTGNNTTIGGLTLTASTTEVQITGLAEDVSTAKNYFLVANVDPSVNGLTPAIRASLANTNVTFAGGLGNATGTATGVNYSFAPLMASFNEITGGTAPVISTTTLEAGQISRVLTGFSATSNGTQEITSINFNISGLTTQLTNVHLYRSTTVGSVGSLLITDANGDGNFNDFTAVAMGDKTLSTTTTYYYLVVDVLNTATDALADITTAPTDSHISLATGGKNALSISRTFSFTQSLSSNIIRQGGNVADITINASNTAASAGDPVTTINSAVLVTFTLQDGGSGDDSDNLPTILDGLTISVENFANLDQVALFDQAGVKIPGTDKTPAATLNWTSLNYSTNTDRSTGGTRNFTIRASFKTIVTDNQQTDIDIIATTSATSTGSVFAATNAGGAGTSGTANNNRTEVSATKLVFVDPDDLPIINTVTPFRGPVFDVMEGQPTANFDLTVAAVDANNNLDFDRTSTITLNIDPSGGGVNFKDSDNASVNPPTPVAMSGGVVTFTNLTVNLPNIYDVGATGGGLTAAADLNNTSISVVIQSAGVGVTAANLSMCKSNSTGDYETLPNIVLDESNNADFDPGAGSFLLILPSGWEFNTAVAGSITFTGGRNISSAGPTFTFLGNTIARFNYQVSGSNQDDVMTLSGLEVRNTGGFATGVITRGGTGVIKGCCDETKPLGTLTTSASALVDFSVQEYPGQPAIPITQTKFPKTSTAIILNGQNPAGGTPDGTIGTFTGTSVTVTNVPELSGNRYTFNPNILTAGIYPVKFSFADGNGCLSEFTQSFEVFEGAINGLAPSYCADNNSPQALTINSSFIPADAIVVQEGGLNTYSLQVPSQKNMSEVTNNGNGTMTVTIRNHGFNNGEEYWMYIANGITGFSGVDAPFGYIYKLCTVSGATTNQFNINVNVVGTWDRYYGEVYLPANYYNYFTGITNNGSSLTINIPDHGFLNGARPYVYVEIFNGVSYSRVEGFFEIQNRTTNDFQIPVTIPGGYNPTGYGYARSNWYRVTSFTPDIKKLNSKLVNVTSYELGYFVKYNWCTGSGCDIRYTVHQTPVQLYPLPIVSFSGLDPLYCEGDAAVALTGSETTGTRIFTSQGGTVADLGNGTATFDPDAQAFSSNINVVYSYTDVNGCTGKYTLPTVVREKEDLPVADDKFYCQDANSLEEAFANVTGEAGAQFKWYNNSSLSVLLGTGESFNTQLPLNNDFSQSFFVTQTTANSCESLPEEVVVTIRPQPDADFATNPGTLCQGKIFNVVGPLAGGTTPHKTYVWNFGDGSALITRSGIHTEPYTYPNSGSANITLTVTDLNDCVTTRTEQFGVNPNPVSSFNYNQVCDDDHTQFHGISADAIEYSWQFFEVTGPSTTTLLNKIARTPSANTAVPDPATNPDLGLIAGTAKDPTFQFPNGPGQYQAIVTAYNNIGCFSDHTKNITILNFETPTTSNSYDMLQLNGGDGYWKPADEAVNSSWAFGTIGVGKPIMDQFFDASPVWVTNPTGLYSKDENSSINSPCFNLQGVLRPTVTLNYAFDLEAGLGGTGIDGAVLEFSKDGGVNWLPLGGTASGINWFNTSTFSTGQIGSSNVGWSGLSSLNLEDNSGNEVLVDGIRALDSNLPLTFAERAKVRFRIVMKSNNTGEFEGFAIKNFRIETRNRLLLIEHFTNKNDPQYGANKTIFDAIDPQERVKIQYHVNSPKEPVQTIDPNTTIGTADQAARAAYYGIVLTDSNIPRAVVDGVSNGSLVAPWFQNRIDKKSLVPSLVDLRVESSQSTEPGYLKAIVTITALDDIDIPGAKPFIHIAAVEAVDGNSNEFVLRKFFTSPIGIRLDLPLTQNEEIIIRDSILVSNGMWPDNDIALVAFIQDEITREVYQSAVELPVPANFPTPITGIEDPTYAEKISFFPNPANDELNILLPANVTRETSLNLVDSYGRVVYQGSFAAGQNRKRINTTELTGGVYIVQINTPEGGVARKKVMVVHH